MNNNIVAKLSKSAFSFMIEVRFYFASFFSYAYFYFYGGKNDHLARMSAF